MTITESVFSRISSSPSIELSPRRRPSKSNGLVTTPIVSAPASLASPAIIGAAPVPVPPPMPAVTKTMSASSTMAFNLSRSSSAATRPFSGFAPAPNPCVVVAPICTRMAL